MVRGRITSSPQSNYMPIGYSYSRLKASDLCSHTYAQNSHISENIGPTMDRHRTISKTICLCYNEPHSSPFFSLLPPPSVSTGKSIRRMRSVQDKVAAPQWPVRSRCSLLVAGGQLALRAGLPEWRGEGSPHSSSLLTSHSLLLSPLLRL